MLCVCVGDVMDVVFSVCIVRRGAVGARVWGVCGLSGPGLVDVMSVWVVSPDYLCRWQAQVSVYYARRIPAHLRCTQCSILCICLWRISQKKLKVNNIVFLIPILFHFPIMSSTSVMLEAFLFYFIRIRSHKLQILYYNCCTYVMPNNGQYIILSLSNIHNWNIQK